MSAQGAVAFLDRVESDEVFAEELAALKEDPNAVYAKVTGAGFEATPEEIKEAALERYGAELTPEQLDQISAGWIQWAAIGVVAGGVIIVAAVIAASF